VVFNYRNFSDKGPAKCSGLDIKQYTETALEQEFQVALKKKMH
jgi:hypothetical protein